MAAPAAPLRVVVADDDEDARFLIRRTLERSGRFSVVAEAVDGAEATIVSEAQHPDLVILDLRMPKVDGIAALPRIREAAPEAVVIVVSALPRERLATQAVDAGAHAVIGKSVSPRRLLEILLKTFEQVHPGTDTPSGRPPALEASLTLDHDRRSPSAARHFVSATLVAWGCTNVTDEALLVTSELVTNAIVHAGSAPELFLRFSGTALHIEVRDVSAASPTPNDASPSDLGGRGLAMVDRMAAAWGVTPTPNGGKAVWVDLNCEPAGVGGIPTSN
jgi:CheY-like chemotaxis protein